METKRQRSENYYAGVIPELTKTKKCRVCGERFRYYPQYHYWKARVNGHTTECVCSYTCMRKIEKREADRYSKYIAEDFEDKEETVKQPKPITNNKAEIVAHLKVKLEAAKRNHKTLEDNENALLDDGVWNHMKTREKEKLRKRRYYWQKRIVALTQEIEQLVK